MSTNYYAVLKEPNREEPIHLGKSSCGWLFLFHETPYFKNYDEFKSWLQINVNDDNGKYVIIDEYNNTVTYDELIEYIDEKQNDTFNIDNPDNFSNCKNVNGYRFCNEEFV